MIKMNFRGDVDNDGRLTVIDMLLIFKYKSDAIKLTPAELQRADTNNDGSVAIADALAIQKHIKGETLIDGYFE